MRILFIWPKIHNPIYKEFDLEKSLFYKLTPMLPELISFSNSLTFPILSALTPNKHSVEVMEVNSRDVNFNKKYDVVGITCTTASAYLSYEIADEFRKNGSFVVLGGYHPSALPEEAKQHADAVVIGEAEETWPQLLRDMDAGKPKQFYEIERPVNAELIPQQHNIYKKDTGFVIQATRGCPNRCEFCSISNMKFRHLFRTRPIENVVEEIRSYPGKSFAFYDDSLTINPEYTKQLFKSIKNLNKRFISYGNINVLGKDEELLKVASEAGCTTWMIGFESVSPQSLKCAGKKTNKVEIYAKHVKKIHEYGMSIIGFFVFGFDHDTLDCFDKTTDMINRCEIDAPLPFILTPLPGTPLFTRLNHAGRILTHDWNKYNLGNVVFQPRYMTPEELLNNSIRTHKEWYKISNNVRRILKSLKFGLRPFVSTTTNNFFTKYPR